MSPASVSYVHDAQFLGQWTNRSLSSYLKLLFYCCFRVLYNYKYWKTEDEIAQSEQVLYRDSLLGWITRIYTWKKIRNAVQKTKFYLNKLLEVFVLLQRIQITKGFGVIQTISLILRVNLSTKLLRKNDRKQRWSLTRQLSKMEWEQSRKGNMVEIPTSVKAETTEAVLPNCVGCSLWNTRRRFFANRVLTCKTNVMKRKFITRSNDESVFHKNYEYGVPLKE